MFLFNNLKRNLLSLKSLYSRVWMSSKSNIIDTFITTWSFQKKLLKNQTCCVPLLYCAQLLSRPALFLSWQTMRREQEKGVLTVAGDRKTIRTLEGLPSVKAILQHCPVSTHCLLMTAMREKLICRPWEGPGLDIRSARSEKHQAADAPPFLSGKNEAITHRQKRAKLEIHNLVQKSLSSFQPLFYLCGSASFFVMQMEGGIGRLGNNFNRAARWKVVSFYLIPMSRYWLHRWGHICSIEVWLHRNHHLNCRLVQRADREQQRQSG